MTYPFASGRSHGHFLPSVRPACAMISSRLDWPARNEVASAAASQRFVMVEGGGMLQRV